MYGTLRRLYAAGALTSYVVPSESGPHRKCYGATSQGRTSLAHQTKQWREFATTMTDLVDTSPTRPPWTRRWILPGWTCRP